MLATDDVGRESLIGLSKQLGPKISLKHIDPRKRTEQRLGGRLRMVEVAEAVEKDDGDDE